MIPLMSFCYLIYLNNNQLCLYIILVMSQESRTQSSNQTLSKNFIETEWKPERSTYSHDDNVTGQERLTWPVMQEQSLADIIFFNCNLTSSSIPTISIYPPLNPHLTKHKKMYNEMQNRAAINCNSRGGLKVQMFLAATTLAKSCWDKTWQKYANLWKVWSHQLMLECQETVLRGGRGRDKVKGKEREKVEIKTKTICEKTIILETFYQHYGLNFKAHAPSSSNPFNCCYILIKIIFLL